MAQYLLLIAYVLHLKNDIQEVTQEFDILAVCHAASRKNTLYSIQGILESFFSFFINLTEGIVTLQYFKNNTKCSLMHLNISWVIWQKSQIFVTPNRQESL